MRYVRIILTLLMALVLVIFSVQNSEYATIKFLGWSAETSMALLLLISFLIGTFTAFLWLSPVIFRRNKQGVPPKAEKKTEVPQDASPPPTNPETWEEESTASPKE